MVITIMLDRLMEAGASHESSVSAAPMAFASVAQPPVADENE
jgi:hypothetical protein